MSTNELNIAKVVNATNKNCEMPKLNKLSRRAIELFLEKRARFEMNCLESGIETPLSLKLGVSEDLLEQIVRFEIAEKDDKGQRYTSRNVPDDILLSTLKNLSVDDTVAVPDVKALVQKYVQMDLTIAEARNRCMSLFASMDNMIKINGLTNIFKKDDTNSDKLYIKLIMTKIEPPAVKNDLELELEVGSPEAKKSLGEFYKVLVRISLKHNPSFIPKKANIKKEEDKGFITKSKRNHVCVASCATPCLLHFCNKNCESPCLKRPPPKSGCLHCKKPHWIEQCPTATAEQKKTLREALYNRMTTKLRNGKELLKKFSAISVTNTTENFYVLSKGIVLPARFDQGSDVNIIAKSSLKKLPKTNYSLQTLKTPVTLALGNVSVDEIDRLSKLSHLTRNIIRMDFMLGNEKGNTLEFKDVLFYLVEGYPMDSILLGNDFIKNRLDINLTSLVDCKLKNNCDVRSKSSNTDDCRNENSDLEDSTNSRNEQDVIQNSQNFNKVERQIENSHFEDSAESTNDLHLYNDADVDIQLGIEDDAVMKQHINDMILRAKTEGLNEPWLTKLKPLVDEYRDIFRYKLGNDPPVKVKPLKVKLKPDAKPQKCTPRQYPKEQREFLDEHFASLLAGNCVKLNPGSHWASPVFCVKKKKGFRSTNDVRYPNSCTIPIQWPLPNLHAVSDLLQDAKYFISVDCFKGFWQLPLHPECQEMFSFMTPTGVYTSNRLVQGQVDAPMYFQASIQEVLGPTYGKNLSAFIDDIIGFVKTLDEWYHLLEYLFKRCRQYGLKLKCFKIQSILQKNHVVW